MFKSLIRTLPSLTGNAKLSLKLNEFIQDKENSNLFHVYVKNATIDPLQNNIYNHDIKVNLLEGSWEYDISRFYRNYFEKFYDINYDVIKDDYIYYDPIQENVNYRNKDYEFGCKRNSYFAYGYQFSFFAPIYITDVDSIPDYFDLHISIKQNNEKIIRIHFDEDTYINKYLTKYLKQIDEKVIFILNESKRATYFGIDAEHGGLVDIVDNNINYIFNYQTTINNFDKIINDGFAKNKIIIRQILPISFDFNIEDILSKIEYKQYAFLKLNKIYGNYVKNYDNMPLYDFDIDYQNMEVNNKNVLSNNTFYSLQEAFLDIYKYNNKICPKYNKWKLSLSSQYDPYYFNINLNFNDSYNKYSKFPRLNNTNTITLETYLYNDKIDINKKIKDGLNNGIISYDELSKSIYEKYVFKKPIYIEEIDSNLKEKLGIDQDEVIYNYIDINNLINKSEYKVNKSENITGWFNIINNLNDIIKDENDDYWTKCLNNYAYFNGILYDFNNYIIDKKIDHLDYFSIFMKPSFMILDHENDLFVINSLFKRSKDNQYNYNFGINTIPLDNFISNKEKNNLFNSYNLNVYYQTNQYIQYSKLDKTKSQYCLIDKYIENKFIDIDTFVKILSSLCLSDNSNLQHNNDMLFFFNMLGDRYIINNDNNNDSINYLNWLINKILKMLDYENSNVNLQSKILFDQYVLIDNIFYINNILSNDQSTFLNSDGNGIGDKSKYVYYKYKYDNTFKNLYEFPININNIDENVKIEFYIKKNLINVGDLYNYIINSLNEEDTPNINQQYYLDNDLTNPKIVFDIIYNYIINNFFNISYGKLLNLYSDTTFYTRIYNYYNLLNLNYYNFNNNNNIYFSKELKFDRPIYVDVTNFPKIYDNKDYSYIKKYIYIKNLQQYNFIKDLLANGNLQLSEIYLCLPLYSDNYNELKIDSNKSTGNDFNINIKYISNKVSETTDVDVFERNIYINSLGFYTNVNICLTNENSVEKKYSTTIDNISYNYENLFTYKTYISNKYLKEVDGKTKISDGFSNNCTDLFILINNRSDTRTKLCEYYNLTIDQEDLDEKTIYVKYILPKILKDINEDKYRYVDKNGITLWETPIFKKFEINTYLLYERQLVDINDLYDKGIDIIEEINKNNKSFYLYSSIESNINTNYKFNFFTSNTNMIFDEGISYIYGEYDEQNQDKDIYTVPYVYQINNSNNFYLNQTTELVNNEIVEPIYNSIYYTDGENDYQKMLITNGYIQNNDGKYIYRSNPPLLNNYAYELSYSEIIDLLVEKIYKSLIDSEYLEETYNVNHPLDIQPFLFMTLYNLITINKDDGTKFTLEDFPKYFNGNEDINNFLNSYFSISDYSIDNLDQYQEFLKTIRLNNVYYKDYFSTLIQNCQYIFREKYQLEDIYEPIEKILVDNDINTISSYIQRFESFDTLLKGNGLTSTTTLTKSLLNDTSINIIDDTDNIDKSKNENNIKKYDLSLLNIIYSIISISSYYIYCHHCKLSSKNCEEYGLNTFYGNVDYIMPLLNYYLSKSEISELVKECNIGNTQLINSKINNSQKVIKFGIRILLVYLFNNQYDIFKRIIKEKLDDIELFEISNYKRLELSSLDDDEFDFDVNKLYDYKFIDNELNTFNVGGKIYGCYVIKSSISNSQNTFNLLNSIYFNHIKKDNQYYPLSQHILYNFTKELLPAIKYNLFDEFNKSFNVYNPILLPEKFILRTQYIAEKNEDLTKSYILNNDVKNIVIDSFNTQSNSTTENSLYKLKKYYNQNLVIHRYTNFIEPVFNQADTVYLYNMKYKNTKALFGNDNIYRSFVNVNQYEGIPLFNDKDQKYLSGNYDTIKEIEYKSFNDNKYFLLMPKFEISFNKYFIYSELLEYEQNDKIIKYFTNYIKKFNSNTKLEENEILFLFNKYKVTFISDPIKLNLNKTKKLYTLKYIFTLL